MVAPIPEDRVLSDHAVAALDPCGWYRTRQDEFGFASSDLFVLSILDDWGTGRWGIGPQVTFPAAEGFGPQVFGYGFAGAIVQRALDDDLFFGLLVQQVWRENPDGVTRAGSFGINPILVYQLGSGFYVGNGDMVALLNWQDGSMLVPLGVRLGKAFIDPKGTWNTYVEYRAPVIVADWKGAIPEHSVRINVQYQIPVAL